MDSGTSDTAVNGMALAVFMQNSILICFVHTIKCSSLSIGRIERWDVFGVESH